MKSMLCQHLPEGHPLRGSMGRYASTVFIGLLALLITESAHAKDLRSWDDKISPAAQRFKILAEFNDEAVLDKETQLVWERTITSAGWVAAVSHCYKSVIGGSMGWRLPTIAELTSLVDRSQSAPALPSGHPFSVGSTPPVWSATTDVTDPTLAWYVDFNDGEALTVGKGAAIWAWCVRGGQGQ